MNSSMGRFRQRHRLTTSATTRTIAAQAESPVCIDFVSGPRTSVPDDKLKPKDYRFLCERHLTLFREGKWKPYAEMKRPYNEQEDLNDFDHAPCPTARFYKLLKRRDCSCNDPSTAALSELF